MRKFLTIAFVLTVGVAAVASAQAMPLAPLDRTQAGIVVPVAGGCGIGFHRGPYGGCRPNAPAAVVVAPGAVVVAPVPAPGPCGGRGYHRVCNAYGRCWRVCN
jgi:hypothetical protein